MFTPNKIKFTDEAISYFSNINHLAKDIKKLFTFLANRERVIFEQLHNIKHNQLLHYISQSYGFESYRDFDPHKLSINISTVENLKNRISQGIKKTTGINDKFIDEVFDLLYLDVSSSRKDTLKSSTMKKIKVRLKKLEDFKNLDIYSDKKKKTKKEKILGEFLREKISEDTHNEIQSLIFNFMHIFGHYEKVINKRYSYVWFAYSFENVFSMSKVEANQDQLEKIGLYLPFKELSCLIQEWIMGANLYKYNTTSIEETYYIQSENEKRYIEEILVDGEISMSYHGGLYMFSNNSYLNELKAEHLKKKNNCIHLKKITWNKHDPYNITIHSYEKDLFSLIDSDGIYIDINEHKEKQNNLKFINFEQPIDYVTGFSVYNGIKYYVTDMKSFYLFKNEESMIEYQAIYNNKLIYSIKFGINRVIILSPDKRMEITYDKFFSITDENKFINI